MEKWEEQWERDYAKAVKLAKINEEHRQARIESERARKEAQKAADAKAKWDYANKLWELDRRARVAKLEGTVPQYGKQTSYGRGWIRPQPTLSQLDRDPSDDE